MPGWLRVGFLVHGLLIMHAGIFLFLDSARMIPVWPWALTALTARAVGTWLAAYGLACLAVARENDPLTSSGTVSSLFAFCILQLLVVVLYFSTIDWTKPLAWLYIVLLLAGVGCTVAALRSSRGELAAASRTA